MTIHTLCPKCGVAIPLSAGEKLPDGNTIVICQQCGSRIKLIGEEAPFYEREVQRTGRIHVGFTVLVALGMSIVIWFANPDLAVGSTTFELVWNFFNNLFIISLALCMGMFWVIDFIFR